MREACYETFLKHPWAWSNSNKRFEWQAETRRRLWCRSSVWTQWLERYTRQVSFRSLETRRYSCARSGWISYTLYPRLTPPTLQIKGKNCGWISAHAYQEVICGWHNFMIKKQKSCFNPSRTSFHRKLKYFKITTIIKLITHIISVQSRKIIIIIALRIHVKEAP